MVLIGTTSEGLKIVWTTVNGPTNYTTGGFTVRLAELRRIVSVSISIRTNLRIANLVHVVDYSVSENTITFTVFRIDVTAAAPSAWAEVPAGTNLSALVIEITAIGY